VGGHQRRALSKDNSRSISQLGSKRNRKYKKIGAPLGRHSRAIRAGSCQWPSRRTASSSCHVLTTGRRCGSGTPRRARHNTRSMAIRAQSGQWPSRQTVSSSCLGRTTRRCGSVCIPICLHMEYLHFFYYCQHCHDAFLRILHGIIPNPAPFDTGIPIAWAYNIGLQYTVPGSCCVEVPLPTYPQLSLDPAQLPSWASDSYPSTVSFTWDHHQVWVQRESGKQLYAA
jgi:hypothetical protein